MQTWNGSVTKIRHERTNGEHDTGTKDIGNTAPDMGYKERKGGEFDPFQRSIELCATAELACMRTRHLSVALSTAAMDYALVFCSSL